MKVIGLTGGIGSGKSTVAQFLSKMGAVVIEADKIAGEVLQDTAVKQELAAAFGGEVITADGSVDRKQLSASVFGNPEALKKLYDIVNPHMYRKTTSRLEEYRRAGTEVVVLDAPTLIEAGITHLVDKIWVTVTPEIVVLERILKRSGLSYEETLARIRSQLSHDERLKYADEVIDTDCPLDELETKVKALWKKLHNQTE